jgi:cysteinyl-tRNA synthetase
VLGLLARDPVAWFTSGPSTVSEARIQELIDARAAARKARDWAESDRIRDELADAGVILEDKPGGKTIWRRR